MGWGPFPAPFPQAPFSHPYYTTGVVICASRIDMWTFSDARPTGLLDKLGDITAAVRRTARKTPKGF